MLVSHEIVLLREALAFWAKHALSLELTDQLDAVNSDSANTEVNLTQDDVIALFNKLAPDNVRYVVVDADTNRTINTRMFRNVPRIQPVSNRWQVRTVLG